MDGQIGTRHSGTFRNVILYFSLLAIIACGLAWPRAVLAEAMGKAQGDATAAPASPEAIIPAPLVAVAPHELVALADVPGLAEGSAAKVPVAPAKAELPAATGTRLAPADTAPTTQGAQGTVAAPAKPSAIESSLIRPGDNAAEPAGTAVTGGGDSGAGSAGKSSLYSRFASVGEVGGALAVVIGLILVGRVLVRKYVPGAALGSGKGVMEILARYPLAKNQALVLVRIGSQLVVLNQTREASQSVLVIHDQTEVANIMGQIQGAKPGSIQGGFSNLLANARMDLEGTPPGASDANIELGDLDTQLDEMAAAKRQLMELRQQVRSVRESMPTG